MRISRLKLDKKFIEMQSYATPGTLTRNAVVDGYNEKDVEELDISNAEWQVILAGLNPETPALRRERKIREEMSKIAEQSLIDKGEL